jgi:hypothetical protein
VVELAGPAFRDLTAIAAAGHRLHAGVNPEAREDRTAFVIFDVGEPEQPRVLGTSSELGQLPADIAVGEGYALTTGNVAGDVVTLSLADPLQPRVEGRCDLDGTPPSGLAVVADTAYVSLSQGPVVTVDLADRQRPWATARQIGFEALGIGLAQSTAYVTAGRRGLRVLDVSRPTRLRVTGMLEDPPTRYEHTLRSHRNLGLPAASQTSAT